MKKILTTSLPIVGVFGLLYLLAAFLIEKNGLQFTNYPNWVSRFALIGVATVAVIRFRLVNNNLIGFKQGFGIALLASLLLSGIIAAHTFFLREQIRPTYNEELKAIHRGILARQEEPRWTEEQITKQIEGPWAFYFTTTGGIIIELLGGLSIGLVAGVSIGYMARRVKA